MLHHRRMVQISIHALREEGDPDPCGRFRGQPDFNPRPPRGGRRVSSGSGNSASDFNPRPPRGGRHAVWPLFYRCLTISIHALREEGDEGDHGRDPRHRHFNPRPPRGGRPPAPGMSCTQHNFNPRPPRGGRRNPSRSSGRTQSISIHALREEGDSSASCNCGVLSVFQSTPSARRATYCLRDLLTFDRHFNPRPPRGGRLHLGGRTGLPYLISIHALREEGDQSASMPCRIWLHFNPRPPRGGRR